MKSKILCFLIVLFMLVISVAAAAPPAAASDLEPTVIQFFDTMDQYYQYYKSNGNMADFIADYSCGYNWWVYWANEREPIYLGSTLRLYFIVEGEAPVGKIPHWYVGLETDTEEICFTELTQYRGLYYIEYPVEFDGYFVISCNFGVDE